MNSRSIRINFRIEFSTLLFSNIIHPHCEFLQNLFIIAFNRRFVQFSMCLCHIFDTINRFITVARLKFCRIIYSTFFLLV